jgi:hypothetical protein
LGKIPTDIVNLPPVYYSKADKTRLFRRGWEEGEKMKFFLPPPIFWGFFSGKIENFSRKKSPC